jgi:hypothetical protein
MFPAMHQSYMVYQNAKVEELEEKLRQAKHTRRLVSTELCDGNKHNKAVLEKYKATKRSMLVQQREELAEHQRKKAAICSEAKAKKQSKKEARSLPKVEVVEENSLPDVVVM